MFKVQDTYATELKSVMRVRFPDCDPFGHLNNARYVDYFQNARTEHLEDYYGFRVIPADNEHSESWVSTKNQIVYLSPANLMEDVVIKTKLLAFNSRILTVEGLMLDITEQQLKAVIWMEFFVIDMHTMRPTTHSAELMNFFEQVRWQDEEIDTHEFDARVKHLRKQYRNQVES